LLLLIFIGATIITLPAGADNAKIRGNWYDDGSPCLIPTGGSLGPGLPPTSVSFGCVGGSVYDGDWIGHTIYTAQGTVDFATGDVHATATQWFTGIYARDGSFGSVHFSSILNANLSTGEFYDSSVILGGTGAFAGSRGRIEFTGFVLTRGLAGSYEGSWSRPARP
jgi:hypothetical protein